MCLLLYEDRLRSVKEVEIGIGFGVLSQHIMRRLFYPFHYLYALYLLLFRIDDDITWLKGIGSYFR